MEEKTPSNSKSFSVPVAIVIAGVLIAGAVVYTNKGSSAQPNVPLGNQPATSVKVDKVTAEDHLLGNPEAKLVIVEYSDLECPYCKTFHQTMKRIMDEYGKNGEVAWVYRHFPLDQIHAKARKEAEATECVAELGGNAAFWDYMNKIFEITPSNDGLDEKLLPLLAEQVGVNKQQFESCLASGRHAATVEAGTQSGLRAGVNGTPFSVIITKDGDSIPLEGAQPYSSVKSVITTLLK